jgi:hypothetical protein
MLLLLTPADLWWQSLALKEQSNKNAAELQFTNYFHPVNTVRRQQIFAYLVLQTYLLQDIFAGQFFGQCQGVQIQDGRW